MLYGTVEQICLTTINCIFQTANREDFECFQHKEMICLVWWIASFPLTVYTCIEISHCTQKYVQLLGKLTV
jgi:hypothetical protein